MSRSFEYRADVKNGPTATHWEDGQEFVVDRHIWSVTYFRPDHILVRRTDSGTPGFTDCDGTVARPTPDRPWWLVTWPDGPQPPTWVTIAAAAMLAEAEPPSPDPVAEKRDDRRREELDELRDLIGAR